MLWFLYVLGTAFVEENKDSRLLQRFKTKISSNRGRRSFDSQGSRNVLSPFDGVVTNQAIAGKVVELASSLKYTKESRTGRDKR